ncbi:hypothetical protein KY315_00955 [Candidatus Woesearchaeota archaeon]|nr:hypothetical protein [Candidatus Woesearchaeota archaeon]
MKQLFFLLFVCSFFLSCGQDIGVTTKKEEVVVPNRVVVEYIIQPTKPETLDVLAIIDTSCSMNDNFEQLSIGLEILKTDIMDITDDFNISFINSSLSGDYYVGPFDQNSTLIDLILAPYLLTRDNYEKPFESLYKFSSEEESAVALRPHADKMFIFVSDEEEQSPFEVNIFKEWLDTYNLGVEHDIITIAITENSDCNINGQDVGYRYNELANYYGKSYIDICGDWSTALVDSSFLVNLQDFINLKHVPLVETIVLTRNDQEETQWYYLTETNTVYFDFEPQEGDIIAVGYNTLETNKDSG